MSSAPIVDRIRIIPRPDDFLDRNVGSSGEVFFNRATNSLRVYSGKDRGGFELALADLSNVTIDNETFDWKSYNTLEDLPNNLENIGMFAYVQDQDKGFVATSNGWEALAYFGESSGGGASVDVSQSAPAEPADGNLWFNTESGKLYIYISDGDSSQWVQPVVPAFSGNYNDLTNKPTIPSSVNDLSDVDTTSSAPEVGNVLKWNGSTWAPAVDIAAGGGGLDADTLDGQDSLYYLNYDNLTNKPTSFQNLVLGGTTTLQGSTEILTSITTATGTIEHDYSVSAVFYHTSISNNFTANFTNVPVTDDRTISIALILVQGATAYIPNAVQIDGTITTINWQGASIPTGNANQIDIVGFTLIRTNEAWTVIGSLSTYG